MVVFLDAHLLAALRYIEQNPMRAKLVTGAQDWRWALHLVRRGG